MSGTLQRSLRLSLHPQRTISPLNSTSTPCFVKRTLQPALQSVATARRLFVIPGHLCATLAAGGSLSRRRSSVSVVFIVSPFGMESDLASCCSLAWRAAARAVRRVMDAAESRRVVLFIFGGMTGLAQPEDKVSVTLILLIIKVGVKLQRSSAGLRRHNLLGALPKPAFHVLPPMVFCWVASHLLPSFLFLQVALLWVL